MASRTLIVAAVLALACQMVAADTLAVWSYKPLARQPLGVSEEVNVVISRIAATTPEVVLYIDSDVTIDASIKNVVKAEFGSRGYDAYLPYSGSNFGLDAKLASALNAKTVVIANAAEAASLSIDGPTVVVFRANPKILSSVFDAIKKTTNSATYVYSVRGLGNVDIIHDRSVRFMNDTDDNSTYTDPTYENSMRFALTFEAIFETYTLFSPATFMGLLTIIVLLITTFVGFSCLMSLQTPSHFEKKQD